MSDPRIENYNAPAAGWGALKNVAVHLLKERIPGKGAKTLLAQNQPDGFDCPGCAWPDREHTSTFEFCENGVKAVAAETTAKRVTPEFFARHTVTALLEQSDYALEGHGRLTHPLAYDAASDTYQPIAWEDAFALIAWHLHALPSPNRVAFYTSGRASNEAAFLYQLFVRRYGTNNFPDCSNMCHEPTSVGLPQSIGVGKGTVTLDDFDQADTLILFGQNPATNHPRMLGELRACAKRGATIVSVNPLRERGLERFASPQHLLDMLSPQGVPISSVFIRPRLGGDLALLKGVAKRVLELDETALASGGERVLDSAFIQEHTADFAAFAADLRQEDWAVLVTESGVSREEIERLTQIFVRGKAVIATWGMGLTQHKHAVATVQMLTNLMLMRGQIGKPGAGLCPVRGHSNVQGDRTVGIDEKPTPAFLERLGRVFGFQPPRTHGYDVVATIEAMLAGQVKVFLGLGGNFVMAAPDTPRVFDAMRGCDLTVHIATKLNRSHLVHGREALILPTLGRTEVHATAAGPQGVTVEDSMSMVHLSYGLNAPASPECRSEIAIVAGIAQAVLPNAGIPWLWYAEDYSRIRDAIEKVYDDFHHFNERVAKPGGFHLRVAARERVWLTASGKAEFKVHAIPRDTPIHRAKARYGDRLLTLMTTRSHDQYNTTIYGLDDRYRGVFGQRMVLFINASDRQRLGFADGALVAVRSLWDDGIERRVEGFRLVDYDIPEGCIGGYYPETNPLVPLGSFADEARTPTSKSLPVLLEPAHAA